MKLPLVSVIIPTHKRPKLLAETIGSIINQDYTNTEIIVVSNGKDEETRSVVERLNESRLSYFERENSGTPAGPRNLGISKSKGKYIAFCDDDDLWAPSKLSKQIQLMEDDHNIGLSYTKMMRFDGDKEWYHDHEACETSLNKLLFVNSIPISSVIVRTSLLEHLGAFVDNSEVGTSEDFEFVLRFAANTKLGFINEFLLKYRSSEGRFTTLNLNLPEHISYLGRYWNCLMSLVKNKQIPFHRIIAPFTYSLLLTLKAVVYNLIHPKQGNKS